MTPGELLARALYDACRPRMREEGFCINAAAVARLVLRELHVKSWPVQCTVIHANRAYAEHVAAGRPEAELGPWWEATGDDPYCTWAQAEVEWKARSSPHQIEASARAGHQGLPGHVVTWVPSWHGYLDPTAGQFTRPEHGIELEPCFWPDALPPPVIGEWRREDGGTTVIWPTELRGYAHAGAWLLRNDSINVDLARQTLEAIS